MQQHLSLRFLTSHFIQVHNWTASTGPSVFTKLENVRSEVTYRWSWNLGPADFLTPVMFDGQVFQQTVGIPMGENRAPLLADLFLFSYEANFIQGLLKKNKKKLARSFNFKFRCMDDALSLNNSRFGEFINWIYPIKLEVKDTTDTDRSASYLDLHLEIDSEGRLRTKIRQKG
jgi:hypothetical protein